ATLMNMGIPERFEIEKSSRPAGIHPNAEEVFAALKKAGLQIIEEKQHLASPLGARYCVGAKTVEGEQTILWLSVCEYVTPDLAKSAGAYSEETLSFSIKNRKVYANRNTALVVKLEQDKPENQQASSKAVEVFTKL